MNLSGWVVSFVVRWFKLMMGKRELVALLYLSSWCLVMVERLFLAVPWGRLRFVIVVFPDHTHLLFLIGCPCQCLFNLLLITFTEVTTLEGVAYST